MQTRTVRCASVFLLGLLLADTLLAGCVGGGPSIRRPEEDAWLLSIAGYYQLTGELPAAPTEGVSKVARLAGSFFQPPEPRTPNEAYSWMEYYLARRDDVEKEARAQGLPAETVAEALGEYEAKIKAYAEKGAALAERRARHRGTAWKRFFDGLGRFIGRAFDIGGRIVKFAVEDVPTAVGEYTPAVVKGLAQAYVQQLKGELRTKAEQKAFEILVERSPNLAGAYLIFKAGKSAVKVLRDFARLFGRHRGRTAAQGPTGTEPAEGGEFELPTSGTMMATCQLPPAAHSVVTWCPTVEGTFTASTPLTVTIDFGSRTFTFGYKSACEGRKNTESTFGTWRQSLSSDEMQGSGTVYEDGWLLGEGAALSISIERGTWWKAGNVLPINKVSENSGTVPVAILLDTPDDLIAFELGWGPGWVTDGPAGAGFTIERARELGWQGLLGFAPDCTTCVSLCEVTSAP
jgi:hypothetical protein